MRAVLAMLLVANAAAAMDSVKVQVASRSIADGDDVQVSFEFSGSGDQQVPSFEPDWTVAGQSNSTSISMLNGRVERSLTATFVLIPTRTGTLRIGAAQLVRGGQVVAQSQPVDVVVRGEAIVKPSEAKKGSPGDDAFFITEIDRDAVFVGEPFLVTAALYLKAGIRVNDVSVQEAKFPEQAQRRPVLSERFREDGQRSFGGQQYNRIVLFQEIWVLLRPETVSVPSLKAVIEVPGRGFMAQQAKVKALPLELEVKPVPSAGRPAGYREGAVGQFTVAATLTPDQARSRAVFEVVITGEGSLETLDPPTIPAVAGATVEALPSDDQDSVTVTANGVTGKRVFQYLVNPQRAGVVQLPSLELHWFNPDTATFESARTEPAQYDASGGVAAVKRTDPERPTFEARARLQPIETSVTIAAPAPPDLHRQPVFLGLLGGSLGLFLGAELFVWMRRRASEGAQNRPKRAMPTAVDRVRSARSGSAAEFYGDLARALRGYLEDRHGIAMAGVVEATLRTELARRGHTEASVEAVLRELDACDGARFAPSGDTGELEGARTRMKALLETLEGER